MSSRDAPSEGRGATVLSLELDAFLADRAVSGLRLLGGATSVPAAASSGREVACCCGRLRASAATPADLLARAFLALAVLALGIASNPGG